MSTTQLTDDNVGKTVVTSPGDEIGIVSGYRYSTADVDPDPGLKTTLLATLGREDTDAGDTITEDQIRLSTDL